MKKRMIGMLIIVIAIFMTNISIAYGYSPHYLPGGKNYLSEANFSIIDEDYVCNDPFLVKPYTDYTLTVPREYIDFEVDDVKVTFYNNSTVVGILMIPSADLAYCKDIEGDWMFSSFQTPSNTNYLSIVFDNHFEYFTKNGFSASQLEEGKAFTGYEPYREGGLIDTAAPYFQNAGTVISYYDSPITVSEIQNSLTAYDAVDGNVTNSIRLVSDNYTSNIDTLGSYEVVFEVADSSENTSQVTVDVELVDVLKPVFSDLGEIEAVYPNTYSVDDILLMLSASDNYDGDLTDQIVLESDTYSEHSSIVGDYSMTFSVADSSGNTQTYTQMIQVVDNEGPIISGITSITIGYDSSISVEEVKDNLSYQDNYDDVELLTLILESDDYTENQSIIGNYSMVFSITDSNQNKTTQTIAIEVVDEIAPQVYFDKSIIQTYTDTVMDLPDFTELLMNAHEISQDSDYLVTVRYDSYTKNAKTPGVYHVQLSLENDTGESYQKDLEIRVIERPADYIHLDNADIENPISSFENYKTYIIGGIISMLLIASNIAWVVIFKKKS